MSSPLGKRVGLGEDDDAVREFGIVVDQHPRGAGIDGMVCLRWQKRESQAQRVGLAGRGRTQQQQVHGIVPRRIESTRPVSAKQTISAGPRSPP